MKHILFLLIGFGLLSCGKANKTLLAEEITGVLWQAAEDKKEQGERILERCQYGLTRKNLRQEEYNKISDVHVHAKSFYLFSDSFRVQYFEADEFSLQELVTRFNQTFDSLATASPDVKVVRFNYLKSNHREDLVLTVTRMVYDIAALESAVMENLSSQYWVTVIQDDFRSP